MDMPPVSDGVFVKKNNESQPKTAQTEITFVHDTDENVVFCDDNVT